MDSGACVEGDTVGRESGVGVIPLGGLTSMICLFKQTYSLLSHARLLHDVCLSM